MENFQETWKMKKCPNCKCDLFKYSDLSKEERVVQCGKTKFTLDIKEMKWIENKSPPCDFIKKGPLN